MSSALSSRHADASRRGWQHRLHLDAQLLFSLLGLSTLGLVVLYSAGGGDIELVERQIPGDPHVPLDRDCVDYIEHSLDDLEGGVAFLEKLLEAPFDPPDALFDRRRLGARLEDGA